MNIGRMRERLAIQIASTSADSAGEYGTPTWTRLTRTWGEVVALTGRERLQAQAFDSQILYRVRLRDHTNLAAVTAKDRVVCYGPDFANSTMQIHAVIRDHAKGVVELDCSEVQA